MAKRNAFYAQSGGVTAVINASAAGVIETARANRTRIGRVLAGRDGIIGALTEDLLDTSRESARGSRIRSSLPPRRMQIERGSSAQQRSAWRRVDAAAAPERNARAVAAVHAWIRSACGREKPEERA